jgi:hypothetical protein
MTPTDFLTVLAQFVVVLFMITLLTLRKRLTDLPRPQPAKMPVHAQDAIERGRAR